MKKSLYEIAQERKKLHVEIVDAIQREHEAENDREAMREIIFPHGVNRYKGGLVVTDINQEGNLYIFPYGQYKPGFEPEGYRNSPYEIAKIRKKIYGTDVRCGYVEFTSVLI